MNLAVCWVALPNKFGVIVTTNQANDNADGAGDEATQALIKLHRKIGKTD